MQSPAETAAIKHNHMKRYQNLAKIPAARISIYSANAENYQKPRPVLHLAFFVLVLA